VKLLIVDRDGVVSRDPDGRVPRAGDWQAQPGSAEAIARFAHDGWRIAMLADCAGLARGSCDMSALNALHGRILESVGDAGGRIDAILFLPSAQTVPDRTERAAEAVRDALARLGASAADTVVVTDSRPDLEAVHAAGCRPVLVLTGHGRATFQSGDLPPGTLVRADLAAVAAELVS
jgi:D-glycero-D-manno-heptose 1,7-bisphosphate phosphatase